MSTQIPNLRWHSLAVGVKISLNSGAGLLLFIGAFFALVLLARGSDRITQLFPVAAPILWGAFAALLVKRHQDRRINGGGTT